MNNNFPLWSNDSLRQIKSLSHAYLVTGAYGSGRLTLIRYLCQMAQCEDNACGHCQACSKIQRNIHPDVLCYGFDKVLNVAEVRSIRDDAFILPNEGKRKIYIIAQADKLNQQGQNALLKILEEPPPYVLFFLITDQGNNVLETIRSRCQILRLQPLSQELCLQYLQQRFPEKENLPYYAQSCGGFLGKAIEQLRPPPEPVEQAPVETNSKKAVKSKRKSVKEPPAPVEELDLQPMLQSLTNALFQEHMDELAVLEACRPMAKLKKLQLAELLLRLRGEIASKTLASPKAYYIRWVARLEEIQQAVEVNVQGEQISTWLCGSLVQERKKQ